MSVMNGDNHYYGDDHGDDGDHHRRDYSSDDHDHVSDCNNDCGIGFGTSYSTSLLAVDSPWPLLRACSQGLRQFAVGNFHEKKTQTPHLGQDHCLKDFMPASGPRSRRGIN